MARIQVIEDDLVSSRLVAHMLRKRGHEVHVSTDAETGWSSMDEAPADLLILDTELEREHGWDVLGRIREDPVLRNLPVIVYSSNSRRDVVERYIALGVQGILIKPYSDERLAREVERVMTNPWKESQFEAPEIVEGRTGLTSTGLKRLYREAADQIAAAIGELEPLKTNPADEAGRARLASIRSCAINVGFTLLIRLLDEAQAAAVAGDADRLAALVGRIPAARRLLEMQAGEARRAEAAPAAPAADPTSEGEAPPTENAA